MVNAALVASVLFDDDVLDDSEISISRDKLVGRLLGARILAGFSSLLSGTAEGKTPDRTIAHGLVLPGGTSAVAGSGSRRGEGKNVQRDKDRRDDTGEQFLFHKAFIFIE